MLTIAETSWWLRRDEVRAAWLAGADPEPALRDAIEMLGEAFELDPSGGALEVAGRLGEAKGRQEAALRCAALGRESLEEGAISAEIRALVAVCDRLAATDDGGQLRALKKLEAALADAPTLSIDPHFATPVDS